MVRTEDYRDVLNEKYEALRSRNPNLSLRKFAAMIGLTPSNLSDVFKGRRGLSARNALKIAEALGMDEGEKKTFLDLVESRHARSHAEKRAALRRLEARRSSPFHDPVRGEEMDVVSRWYYVAALELVTLCHGLIEAHELSARLSISQEEAERTFETLEKLRLIERREARWVRTKDHLLAESPSPSNSIREFHGQILDLAKDAVHEQAMEERKFSSTLMTFDSRRMDEVRAFLNEMNDEFFRRFEAQTTGDSVRCFSFQFFRVDESGGVQ